MNLRDTSDCHHQPPYEEYKDKVGPQTASQYHLHRPAALWKNALYFTSCISNFIRIHNLFAMSNIALLDSGVPLTDDELRCLMSFDWSGSDQLQNTLFNILQPTVPYLPLQPVEPFGGSLNARVDSDPVSSTHAPSESVSAASLQPSQAPVAPPLQGNNGWLGRTSFLISVKPNPHPPPPPGQVSSAGNVGVSRQFGIAPAPQESTRTGSVYNQWDVADYFPTPESSTRSPVVPVNSTMAEGNFDNALAVSGQPAAYASLDLQAGTAWDQQASPMNPSMYQTQPNYNTFVPVQTQFQPAQHAQPCLSGFQFTFEPPVPPPLSTANHSLVNGVTPFYQANPVPLSTTHCTSALPTGPGPSHMVRSKSVHSTQLHNLECQTHKDTLKRGPSIPSARPSRSRANKRRKVPVEDEHPSIPQGEWRQELKELNLNAEGKYYIPPRERGPLRLDGATVRDYACLYYDPFYEMGCWRRSRWGQPEEWLRAVSNGTRQKGKVGFFPRHEAEMLRHLAIHRKEEVLAVRAMPKSANLATLWLDKPIDEQILKDRDDPDNQIWYPDEKRKSREELNEELTFSSLYQG
ncbi:hypothetical protein OPQ81_008981 [Rhizoctonia solani]|nr:hypothetical protein OPQ81_008981 [Rhizoctonia solani]